VKERGNVLIVDDDDLVVTMLSSLLTARAQDFAVATSVSAALEALGREHFDVVLLDVHLPDGDGRTVLERALALASPPSVLLMTARAELRAAVDAMRRGATDYLEKPLDLDDFAARLDRAEETASLRRKLAAYEARDEALGTAVVESAALTDLFNVAARVAATPVSSALILGESGVGKEVLASRIHALSDRRAGPFVRVNLAAIPESMIEAELFGSVRGAYTDSKRDRAGLFASAEGGTLLLDELCEFKSELQPKLLRALEERRYFPVGSDRERKMNVRVLAATNRDPLESIKNGTLRADLYYRLATVILRIPPLRERRADVLALAEHFLMRFRSEFRRPRLALGQAARDALVAYDWPGNARELRNVVERAAMLTPDDTIEVDDLGLPVQVNAAPVVAESTDGEHLSLEQMERTHIARVLAQVDGSRTVAARLLGISRSTLWDKGRRYGLF
jgi:two-component system response regulator HydG